jgi:hypothetical protein
MRPIALCFFNKEGGKRRRRKKRMSTQIPQRAPNFDCSGAEKSPRHHVVVPSGPNFFCLSSARGGFLLCPLVCLSLQQPHVPRQTDRPVRRFEPLWPIRPWPPPPKPTGRLVRRCRPGHFVSQHLLACVRLASSLVRFWSVQAACLTHATGPSHGARTTHTHRHTDTDRLLATLGVVSQAAKQPSSQATSQSTPIVAA